MYKLLINKNLNFKLVIPISILLFGTVTKWQYVFVEDGVDDFFIGFPFAYTCSGWHTSMSKQIFIIEFLIDFIVYYSFCFLVINLIHKFIKPINVSKLFAKILYALVGLIILLYAFILCNPNNIFISKNEYKYKVVKSGYKFMWQDIER
jgi:hypothetical protein